MIGPTQAHGGIDLLKVNTLLLLAIMLMLWPAMGADRETPQPVNRYDAVVRVYGALSYDPEVTAYVDLVRTNRPYMGVLPNMRSDKARAALLRIAFGEIRESFVIGAAGCYENSLEFKRDAAVLLDSPLEQAFAAGLRGLCQSKPWPWEIRGNTNSPQYKDKIKQQEHTWKIDDGLFLRIARAMRSNEINTRELGVQVLARDNDPTWAIQKCAAIVESMKTTINCRDAKTETKSEGLFFETAISKWEESVYTQAYLLGRISGLPNGHLTRMTPVEPGLVRDAFILARDVAGDVDSRNEMHIIMAKSPSIYSRMMMLWRVREAPRKEDVPALMEIAGSDTFQSRPSLEYFKMEGADHSLRTNKSAKIYPIQILAAHELKRRSLDKK